MKKKRQTENVKKYLLICIILLQTITAIGQTIKNRYYSVSFDKNTGKTNAIKSAGDTLLSGALTAVNFNGNTYTSESKNYSFNNIQIDDEDDKKVLNIEGIDKSGQLNFVTRITLFSNNPAIGFEVIYKNVSGKNLITGSIEPLRIIAGNNSGLHFKNASQCLTNGAMYYDAGFIHSLVNPWNKPEPYGEAKGGVVLDSIIVNNPMTVQSWWNIAVFNGYTNKALAAGYLLNKNSIGRLQLLKNNDNHISLVAESVLNPGFTLKPGDTINSDLLVLIEGENPYTVNEIYASLMAEEMQRLACSVVNGWCNWFYTMSDFGEEEILENARFASKHLKQFGLEYIQIDEGFQTTHGDWRGNKRFPNGLKYLCDSIKKLGLKPGIWISPFVISENSQVFYDHPDWLLKDEYGNPLRIGPWPSENTDWFRNESPKRYCLDITHPEAEKWFTDLIDTISNRWGFEMIKVDFVAWTVFSARQFYNPGMSPAQVYRKAMEIMRNVAGNSCHILDCGPGHVSGGYINSMRIEYDQNYGFSENAWTQYFRGASCSAGAAGKRYFYNNKVWTNDIDHVCIDLLSLHEAQAVATLIGISGGNVMSGDRLLNLDATKLDILKKILPSTPEQGKPVDLLENDPQTIFSCPVTREFDSWNITAFFNPDRENSLIRKISLKKLGLDDNKSYLAFDFWKQQFAGELNDEWMININPGSVSLYSLRKKTNLPQIIGTNRHIKQGAVEIESVRFDKKSNILSAVSTAPPESSHSVFIFIPEGYNWMPENGVLFQFENSYTIRKVEENILRIDLFFKGSEKTNWEINFSKQF